MFAPRKTQPVTDWKDPDGLKLYSISATNEEVDIKRFIPRLDDIKNTKPIHWNSAAAFAIFHEGASMDYLVVAWWGNGNELFTSVSASENGERIEDPSRISFCLWDLEVIWHERNSYIQHMYSGELNLETYRNDLKRPNKQIETREVK